MSKKFPGWLGGILVGGSVPCIACGLDHMLILIIGGSLLIAGITFMVDEDTIDMREEIENLKKELGK